MIVAAQRQMIHSGAQTSHQVVAGTVAAMRQSLDAGWVMPPVLAVEDMGNGALLLDGHHRARAARECGIHDIDAWVVSRADFDALIEAEFAGEVPGRLADLDEYILCAGKPYERP